MFLALFIFFTVGIIENVNGILYTALLFTVGERNDTLRE